MLNNSHRTLNLKKRIALVGVETLEQNRLNMRLPLMIALLAAATLLVAGLTLAAASDGIIWLVMWGWVCGWPLARKYSWNGSHTWDSKHSRNRKYSWNSKYSWNGSIAWLSSLSISNMALAPVYWVTETP